MPALLPSPNSSVDPAGLRTEWGTAFDLEPEFFGNPVLNDTSLVVLAEARLDGVHRRRVLLSGDLENWLYLTARHPRGIDCDVLKAPHHDGRVFIEHEEAYDEVYQYLRPRVVLVSANGKHRLPRALFRDAVARWGGTLFCPCRGRREILQGDLTLETSCHDLFRCTHPNRCQEYLDGIDFRLKTCSQHLLSCAFAR
jgi:hypothetical protein